MKFLALFCLIGFAAASFVDVLDHASDEFVADFMIGMESAPALREALGAELAEEADKVDDDIKTALGKTLRESLDNILGKIRDTVDHGKKVSEDLVNKAKEITQKLKDIGVDAGSKAKDLLERIKSKAQEWLRNLLNKAGLGKRAIGDILSNLVSQLNFGSLLEKLKAKIAEKVDINVIVEYIRSVFGDSPLGKALFELAKAKGVDAIKSLIGKLLPGSNYQSYSILSSWERVKEFFKGLGVKISEKFADFSAWLKVTVSSGIENAKDKAGQLKVIAKQVIDHSKTLTKEAAREALEFFQPYKEDLGSLWDELKDTVRRVVGTKEF